MGFELPLEEAFHEKISFGDAMEDVAWVHEGQGGFAKLMHALILM